MRSSGGKQVPYFVLHFTHKVEIRHPWLHHKHVCSFPHIPVLWGKKSTQ